MNAFATILKSSIEKRYDIEVDVFFSRKKLLHIGFEKTLSTYDFFDELLDYIEFLWFNPVNFVAGYELIFPCPTKERNMFYIFFQRKKNG